MDLITKAKSIQIEISQLLREDNLEKLTSKFDDLDAIYRVFNSMVSEVKLIRRNCQTEISSRIRKIRNEVDILEQDHPTAAEIQLLQSRDHGMRDLAPGIPVHVVAVPTEDFIPDSPLYFIKSTEEFAIRINGNVIHGHIRNFGKTSRSIRCRSLSCVDPKCKWGHLTKDRELTWSPGSWLYTQDSLQKKNVHMRHIGSRNTLFSDIRSVTRAELAERSQQTAHDLLIQIAIDSLHSLH